MDSHITQISPLASNVKQIPVAVWMMLVNFIYYISIINDKEIQELLS